MDTILNSDFDLMSVLKSNIKSLYLSGANNKERRLVYASGFYFSLVFALYYEEAERPVVLDGLWSYIKTYQKPQPSTVELVTVIAQMSHNRILLDTKLIPNPAFRYGLYGHLYSKGIRDSFDLCVNTIPGKIMEIVGGNNRSPVLTWIDVQMNALNPLQKDIKIKYVNV